MPLIRLVFCESSDVFWLHPASALIQISEVNEKSARNIAKSLGRRYDQSIICFSRECIAQVSRLFPTALKPEHYLDHVTLNA